MYDVLIIGCGVTGAAAAFELSRYRLRVGIVERENDVALGTTKANSAILHAGYDPEPGTLMARLNVRGVELARELCQKLDVPYRPCGSLVLAFSEEERPALEELYRRGQANGVPGLKLLDGAVARSLEPNLSDEVAAALHAPSAAICSPWEYCLALAETAVKNGAELHLNTAVTGLERLQAGEAGPSWLVHTNQGDFEARFVLNAAGVDAAGVHDLAAPHSFDIRPARGQYYLLDKSEGGRVSRVIFQCPSAAGKGVLVAPTVHGNLIVGPDSEKVEGNDTATTGDGLRFVRETARKSVPSVSFRESIRNFAGVRAASGRPDFILEESAPGFIDLAGICSAVRRPRHRGIRGGAAGQGGAGPGAEGRFRLPTPPHPLQGAVPGGTRRPGGAGARLRPGDLPLRDSHRGGDFRGPPRPHPPGVRGRGEAEGERGHGPLPGGVLRAPGGGPAGPGAAQIPGGDCAGSGRVLAAGPPDEVRFPPSPGGWKHRPAGRRREVCMTSL